MNLLERQIDYLSNINKIVNYNVSKEIINKSIVILVELSKIDKVPITHAFEDDSIEFGWELDGPYGLWIEIYKDDIIISGLFETFEFEHSVNKINYDILKMLHHLIFKGFLWATLEEKVS